MFPSENTGSSFQTTELELSSCPWPPATRSAVKRRPTQRCRYVTKKQTAKCGEKLTMFVIKIFFIPWFQDYESFKSDTFSDKLVFMTFASPTILRHLHRSGISLLHPRTQDVKPAECHRTDRRTAGEIYKVKTVNIVFLGLIWSYWWYILPKTDQ